MFNLCFFFVQVDFARQRLMNAKGHLVKTVAPALTDFLDMFVTALPPILERIVKHVK